MFRPPLPAAQCRAPISSQKIHKKCEEFYIKLLTNYIVSDTIIASKETEQCSGKGGYPNETNHVQFDAVGGCHAGD